MARDRCSILLTPTHHCEVVGGKHRFEVGGFSGDFTAVGTTAVEGQAGQGDTAVIAECFLQQNSS